MRFIVIPNRGRVPLEGRDVAYLWTDNWNDWFRFQTLYALRYFDPEGDLHEIGAVKIGQFDMDQARPELPADFEELDERFFSLGQDASYYSSIAGLDEELSSRLLTALRDVVADPDLFYRALDQDVMGVSLLRSVTARSVEGQFRRILAGGAVLTNYTFRYQGPEPDEEGIDRLNLEFRVIPESRPPTNIHVLIGRNGVGKTYLLNRMTGALLSPGEDPEKDGLFISEENIFEETNESPFANILSVTFSAFDEFTQVREGRNVSRKVRYSNVSLRRQVRDKDGELVTITQDPVELAEEFSASARLCVIGQRAARWQQALTTLQADPIFAEAEVAGLVGLDQTSFTRTARQIYRQLSSGHKIVLLTITKLVEKVEEKTLVLLDEPEAHLHPPLLSAFVRALSDLLINRNGVAIIATHSPVVLQEVPASCVWKIIRHGLAARADRPEIETFAENIGVLTREIFGLEVTRSGFHRMLAEAIADLDTIDAVLRRFDNEVGSEGRALISSLLAARRATDGQ
jgi:ABC-type transport system involved in cytochrome c biogenesis ATPase subunit